MSFKIRITCDGYRCFNRIFTDDPDEISHVISWEKWQDDPDVIGQHYCPKCWAEVQKEKAAEQEEKQ